LEAVDDKKDVERQRVLLKETAITFVAGTVPCFLIISTYSSSTNCSRYR
jgi:hypothetical protein